MSLLLLFNSSTSTGNYTYTGSVTMTMVIASPASGPAGNYAYTGSVLMTMVIASPATGPVGPTGAVFLDAASIRFNHKSEMILYVNNDNLVELLGLIDEISGDYVDDASMTVSLIDNQRNVQQGPVTMTYVSNSKGNYFGILPASSTLVVGSGYRVLIAVTDGSSSAQWYLPVVVQFRE